MRAYINGKLTKPNRESFPDDFVFLPSGLWFANSEEDFDFEITDNCMRLDGLYTESSVKNNEFYCKWKGLELNYIDDVDGYTESQDFTIEDFANLVISKSMRLVNMDAYCDGNINVEITNFELVDSGDSFEFDTDLIDEIEFIE